MEIIDSYKLWLQSKSYSDATIRNYLVDLRKYFLFSCDSVETHDRASLPEISTKIFNQDNLSSYFQNINQDQNYKRFLASLSKFFQFALDQKLISENPFEKALKNMGEPTQSVENIISQYQEQLEHKKFSLSTIRNYINDIHQFINWAQSSSGRDESRPYKNNVGV
jgi:site-specific recombinase XerD